MYIVVMDKKLVEAILQDFSPLCDDEAFRGYMV